MTQAKTHWNTVYREKSAADVSWFQPEAQPSLDLILQHRDLAVQGVIDVGAGASRLVDGLLAAGLTDVTLLDVAKTAFDPVRQRLGPQGDLPNYVIANAADWQPDRQFGVWHDRAAFHFLTAKIDQDHYLTTLRKSLVPRGIAILATFAPDGPEFCSGLPVQRYSSAEIGDRLGPSFALVEALSVSHMTPQGKEQRFQYAVLRKTE
tara:strand:+ start:3750 stop:4367 length:618 start_codon:yes stop_codon:yes gene_type:complete